MSAVIIDGGVRRGGPFGFGGGILKVAARAAGGGGQQRRVGLRFTAPLALARRRVKKLANIC